MTPLSAPLGYYSLSLAQRPYCNARFSVEYLEDIRRHEASYCGPSSRSSMTCFHSHSRVNDDNNEHQVDSLCVGQGVSMDPALGKFSLHCAVRELTADEREKGLVPLFNLRPYWYETGPPKVFEAAVDFHNDAHKLEHEGSAPQLDDPKSVGGGDVAEYDAPSAFLLLKREGDGNVWHCLLEIMSTYMTFDVLGMSRDPLRDNKPYFNSSEEAANTQVVILDDWSNGPFFDLWTLFARRPPIRLKELAANPAAMKAVKDAKIIVPLTGSSNPLWQRSEVRGCTHAPTVSVFSQRVRDHFKVQDPAPQRKEDRIRLTFVDRRSRRLHNQTELFQELARRHPHVEVKLIDFEGMPFPEQIRVARETEILAGVHGAGLTHTMFMREAAGAVVEIQHEEVNVETFRVLAHQRYLSYFRAHGKALPNPKNPDEKDWHWKDVELEPERFFALMDAAIKSIHSIHPWNLDVDRTS